MNRFTEGLPEELFEEVPAGGSDDDVIEVDFGTVGVVPPRGRYVVEVISAMKTVSRAGNPMVVLNMVIVEPEQYAGVSVRDNLLLKEGFGLVRTKEAFEALGLPNRVSVHAFRGRRCVVQLAPQESDAFGPRAQVQHYYKL